MSIITDFVATIMADMAPPLMDSAPCEPPETPSRFPTIMVVDPPTYASNNVPTLDDARMIIRAAIDEYLHIDHPDHMLLIRAGAGSGKTHICVHVTEELAQAGQRILYVGPRHKFFTDLLQIATRPDLWYEWLPQQAGDEETGKVETCRHAREIMAWHARGYDGMLFCERVCGWDYIAKCQYHLQKFRPEPCIFGQYAHLFAHPLKFDVLIGDEDPTSAFMHEWVIGARHIMPSGLNQADDLTHILHNMCNLALRAKKLSGPELLEQLGGAQYVLEACASFMARPDSLPLIPKLRNAQDVYKVDYFHLPALVDLLRREARLCLTGDYLHRVILNDEKLLLLLRRRPAKKLPEHIIWLDATGNARIYESLFGRRVRVIDAQPKPAGEIIQVYNRNNNISSLIVNEHERATAVMQLQVQVDVIAALHPGAALITYQDLETTLSRNVLPHLHFYAARGTNVFNTCAALIVAGTPMPALDDITKIARMVFFERDEKFDMRWSARPVSYNYTASDGSGRARDVFGFWHDSDLQTILWSCREAELIQAVHRARILTRNVPVYLLSALPLPDLPITRLINIRELLNAPAGVNAFTWSTVLSVAHNLASKQGFTIADLEKHLGVSRVTATKYFNILARDTANWERVEILRKTRGRPTNILRPIG